jgi:alpha-beta hydrolase superfamily lysophospholipase
VTHVRTDDGVDLATHRFVAAGEPRGAVVLVHGFSATKDDPNVVGVAAALAGAGLDVITYDSRGHGGSGGTCTLGDTERHDVAAAIELARVRTPNVVLVGASMGAIAVLRAGACDPHVRGVVTVSAPSSWRLPRTARALFAAGLTRTSAGRRAAARWLHVRVEPRWSNPTSPRDVAAELTVPLVVIHGEHDRFIHRHDAVDLYRHAGSEARLVMVPRMGHSFAPACVGAVLDAVDWVLGAKDAATTSA